MAIPKEPRQKMINLMYLVLTALLALNVSSEILNAFKTVDASLVTANGTIDNKNNAIFKSFAQKLNDPKTAERARIWEPKAQEAKKASEEVYAYIDGLKMEIKKAAGYNPPTEPNFKEDNLDVPTRLMLTEGRANQLKARLQQLKDKLLSLDPSIRAQFEKTLPINLEAIKTSNEATSNDWGSGYFHMTPTIAAITILSKFQNDVRNAEAQVVDYIHSKVGEVEIVYDEFQAFAGTNSQYLMPGQELVITAGVGAFSRAAKPSITIDGTGVGLNTEGVAEYKTTVGGPGTY